MTTSDVGNDIDAVKGSCIDESTDARALQDMMQTLKRIAVQNQLERSKYTNNPEKFMDSELLLHQQLTIWKQLAAFPRLYIHLINMKQEIVPLFLSFFEHENIDIRLEIVAIFAEWFDIDNLGMISEHELEVVTSLAIIFSEEKLLYLVVEFISQRLVQESTSYAIQKADTTPSDEDDATDMEAGFYNALQILENMAELTPEACIVTCEEKDLLTVLVKLIMEPKKDDADGSTSNTAYDNKFPQTRVYASEVLSILLQLGTRVQHAFLQCSAPSRDAKEMDYLLQIVSKYRKRGPLSVEEEEFVENIVNIVCILLLLQEAKTHFRHLEGLELMLKVLQNRESYLFASALRVLDHALMECSRNCEHIVEIGGIKYLFSILMGKTSRYKSLFEHKGAKNRSKHLQEEHIISIIASLCVNLSENARADGFARFHIKFFENDFEKMDRLVELFARYQDRLKKHMQEEETASLSHNDGSGSMTDEERKVLEEAKLARQLDAGLYSMQRLANILIHCSAYSVKLKSFLAVKFHERQLEYDVLETLV